MSYGIKYVTQFDSQTDDNNPSVRYTLQFLFKDYSGAIISVDGAGTTVVQTCTIDDPFAPIKGQALQMSLLNRGNIPITSFYAENDSDIQVKLFDDTGLIKFVGFLVQDDCREVMVDFAHEIQLSATDGLGLLKDTILSDARLRRQYNGVVRTNGALDQILISTASTSFYTATGDTFELLGIEYTVVSVSTVPVTILGQLYNYTLTVTPAAGGAIAPIDTPFYITGVLNLQNRNSLLTLIGLCISATNLSLITNIFCNLREYRQNTTNSHFEQTLIDSQTFISSETYEDCYSVLTKIMQTFECSIFQANGEWQIVHWFEIRKYPAFAINGFIYDEVLTLLGNTTFGNIFYIGPDPQLTRPTYSLLQSIVRPYKFTRKTFNYVTPKYLLKNYDLQQLGALRTTYVSGTTRISEYEAPGWQGIYGTPAVTRFIRVEFDLTLQRESDRYLVISGPTFDSARALPSENIEVNIGDTLKFSCSFRTNISQPSPLNFAWAVRLLSGTTNRYVDDVPAGAGDWTAGVSFGYIQGAGENSNTWHQIEIPSSRIPYSGNVYCYLPQFTQGTQSAAKECHFKDLRFEYTPYVNDTTKVIGHIHKDNRTNDIKNFSDEVITIDDTPRNSIIGTLFLDTKTDDVQDRTLIWEYGTDFNGYKLGQITTIEMLTNRSKPRSKFEGGFIGLKQSAAVSLLTMAITDFYTTKCYIFGLLSIDYKRNQFDGTLFEIYDTAEPALDADYTFNYIYSTT